MLIVILLIGFWLRLYRLDFQDIWWDEGRNIDVASRDLAIIASSGELDIHPPLYFYILHLWMEQVGQEEFAVRFLSLAFSILTISLFFRIGHRWNGPVVGFLAAVIAAFSPFYVAEAQETRMYTLAIFLSCLSFYWLYRGWRGDGVHFWVGYIFTAAGSIYTHYSAGYVLIFQNFVLALSMLFFSRLRRRPKTSPAEGSQRRSEPFTTTLERGSLVTRWVLSQGSVALLFLPQLNRAIKQIGSYKNPTFSAPDPLSVLRETWQAFTLGPATVPGQTTLLFLGGIGLLLVLGLGLGTFSRHRERNTSVLLLISGLWVALPLALYYLVLRDRPFFHPRYIMLATPGYFFLLAGALWAIWQRTSWLAGLGTAFLILAFIPSLNSHYFDPAYFRDDTSGLAHFIEEEATRDDIVFIDVPYPFHYYYRGEAPAYYLFVDIHTVAQRISQHCQNRQRLFFIRWHKSDTDPRGAVLFLLEKYGERLGEKRFRGYEVVWYQLPPDCSLSLTSHIEPIQADFDHKIRLTGYAFGGRGSGATSSQEEVESLEIAPGRKAWVVLLWQLQEAVEEDYKVAVYLQDAEGHVVGQDDRRLINDRHLYTSAWGLEEVVTNVYSILVAPGTPPGEYAIVVAVYSPTSLARLGVLDERGAPMGTTLPLASLPVVPPQVPPALETLNIQHPLAADTAEGIKLLGYDLGNQVIGPGGQLSIALYWQATAEIESDYKVRLQVRDEDGRVWGELTQRPNHGQYPTNLWRKGDILRDWYDLSLRADTPSGAKEIGLSLLDQKGVAQSELTLTTIQVEGRQRIFEVPVIAHRLTTDLGDRVRFLGYDLKTTSLQPGQVLYLTLYWQALAEMDASYTVFTHLLDRESKIWGQKDSVPGGGALPTSGWLKGEIIVDHYEIVLNPETPGGEYRLEIGMYRAETGQRLPVEDEQGVAQGDRILLEEVIINVLK
ncbi:MAG: glycosyltransferase family 39 protein [Anaerolineae bacterium]